MSSDDKQNDWSQDPSLSGIDFARLQALQQMASQSRGKSQAEMMPFLFSLMQGNQGGAQFSASEADPDHLCHQSRKIQTGSGKN